MLFLSMTDQELVSGYISGNEQCLEILIRRHQSKIYASIRKQIKDPELSNDIFQDTFIKVINTLKSGQYNEEGKFIYWVIRIAHNLIIDHFRKNNRFNEIETQYEDFDLFSIIPIDQKNIEEDIISTQTQNEIKEMIKLLPEDQKQVLTLRMYDDLSFKEIAESTNVSINTALGRMRYAILNLRKMAEEKKLISA